MIGALARWFGYSTWFALALAASLYWSIPKDDIRRLVQHKASQKLKTKVTIDKLAFHGVTGVSVLGLEMVLPIKKGAPPATPGTPGAPAAEPPPGGEEPAVETKEEPAIPLDLPGLLLADSIRVDVNTLGLLLGQKLKARVTAEISRGTIDDTTFQITPDGWSLHVGAIDGVDLGPIKVLRTLGKMDLDLMTRLSGKLDFEWGGSLDSSHGEVELELADTVLPYLPIKDPRQPFPIGEAFEVQLGSIQLKATLAKPDKLPGVRPRPGSPVTLLLEKLSARGEHVELQLDGGQKHTIAFVGKQAGEAELDITLVLSFTDAFFAWKGVGHRPDGSEVPDGSHEGLKMGLEAGLRAARTVIGQRSYYGFHCQGPLKDFKCLPKAPSRRLTPIAAPAEAAPTGGADPDGGDVEASARPSPPARPGRPGARANTPSPRLAQPLARGDQPAAPRLVEPTRPADERLEALRAQGVPGAPGDTLGPGVGGGLVPPPEPEPLPEVPPSEEPTAAEALPEPIEPAPAEAPAEGEPGEGEAAPEEAVDGADGVPAEGEEQPAEETLE